MPADALAALAAQLRADDSVISPYVVDPPERPVLGELAAAGSRSAGDPHAYALVVESVREGYLLHYGEPRVVVGADRDLCLLAGDYLYALGLERLAALGDLPAVRQLSDLISLAAQLHAEAEDPGDTAGALWLATVAAIATGAGAELEAAKAAVRAGESGSGAALAAAATKIAEESGLGGRLADTADGIDFRAARLN